MEGVFTAEVIRNELAGQATSWLGLRIGGDAPLRIAPGSIIALTLPDGARRPYTVSRARPAAREVDLLIRVVQGGRVSPRLAAMPIGAQLSIQGTWGRPIRDLVVPGAQSVIGVSTGTGIGPLLGYAAETQHRLTLVGGFRTAADVCVDEVPRGVRLHFTLSAPGARWVGLRGHSTVSAPPVLDDLVGAHVHLVGNGVMVRTWTEAIHRAGVPVAGVSSEIYFGKHMPVEEAAVARLAAALRLRGEQLGAGALSR